MLECSMLDVQRSRCGLYVAVPGILLLMCILQFRVVETAVVGRWPNSITACRKGSCMAVVVDGWLEACARAFL